MPLHVGAIVVLVELVTSGVQPVFVFNEKEQTGGLITQTVWEAIETSWQSFLTFRFKV